MSNAGSEADRRDNERLAEAQAAWQGMSLGELRALSDDDLVRRYDSLMQPDLGIGALGPEDYLAELTRRADERQTTWLVRLTWVIAVLTVVLVALELLPRIVGEGH